MALLPISEQALTLADCVFTKGTSDCLFFLIFFFLDCLLREMLSPVYIWISILPYQPSWVVCSFVVIV